jgi:peptide/nickel transport system substrate-binding protein
VEVLGPYRVRFRFSHPYADQLAHLRKVIMPKHLLEKIPSAEMESAPFNRNPVGNGPFRFVRWKQQQEVVLEANPDFPDGRPHLDRVVIRTIPDQTAIETGLRSGQVDVVDRLRYETLESFRKDDGFQVLGYEQRGYQFIGWNLRDPLFADANVRRAMTLGINRQRILDALVFGEGKVTANPIMSLSPFYAEDIEPYPFDPELATQLLAAAGWSDADADGVLDKAGQPFRFELVTNLGNQLREDTLVMIQDDLKRIGIVVVPQVREWSVFLDEIKAKRFQAFHMAWQVDFIVNPYDTFHSGSIEGKYNMGSYSSPRVDELIDEGLLKRTQAEAMPIWHEFQEILHRDQPYTILFELRYSVGASRRIRGMKIDARGTFVNVEEWWIAPKDRKYAS